MFLWSNIDIDISLCIQVVNDTKFVFDTGTSILAGPKALVKEIARQVGAKPFPLQPAEYTVPCGKVKELPDVNIVIGGQTFTLTPDDYGA